LIVAQPVFVDKDEGDPSPWLSLKQNEQTEFVHTNISFDVIKATTLDFL
jgi:hypothetical protein